MSQDGSPAEVKLLPNLTQPRPSHGRRKRSFVLVIEQQKAAAASANLFAAKGSVSARQLIHFVNETATHPRRAFFLVLPMNVHQFGKLAQIASQQRVPAFVAKLLGKVQIVQHLAGVVASSRVLIAQNFRR